MCVCVGVVVVVVIKLNTDQHKAHILWPISAEANIWHVLLTSTFLFDKISSFFSSITLPVPHSFLSRRFTA